MIPEEATGTAYRAFRDEYERRAPTERPLRHIAGGGAMRAALEAATPLIAGCAMERMKADLSKLAQWLLDADLPDSLEVIGILAAGDPSKALARAEAIEIEEDA